MKKGKIYQFNVFKKKDNILIYWDGKVDRKILDELIYDIVYNDLKDKDLVEITKAEEIKKHKPDELPYRIIKTDMTVGEVKRLYDNVPVECGSGTSLGESYGKR